MGGYGTSSRSKRLSAPVVAEGVLVDVDVEVGLETLVVTTVEENGTQDASTDAALP